MYRPSEMYAATPGITPSSALVSLVLEEAAVDEVDGVAVLRLRVAVVENMCVLDDERPLCLVEIRLLHQDRLLRGKRHNRPGRDCMILFTWKCTRNCG